MVDTIVKKRKKKHFDFILVCISYLILYAAESNSQFTIQFASLILQVIQMKSI